MNKNKYVFAQLVEFLDKDKFRHLVDKYNGNRYVKSFTCWNQLLALMFGQLSNRESLRDVVVSLEAHHTKCYHLGMGRNPIAKTTFASANQNRDYRIFEDFAFFMMEHARKKQATDIFKLKGHVYAFDSTTIPLCLSIFWWAKFRKKKGGIKAHVLYYLEAKVPAYFHISTASVHDSKTMKYIPYESGSYYVFDRGYNAFKELYKIHLHESFFVVRAKKNLQFKCIRWERRLPKNVLANSVIELTDIITRLKYTERLRLVKYRDEDQDRELVFLTNAFHLTSLEIAELYKNRWQVEPDWKTFKEIGTSYDYNKMVEYYGFDEMRDNGEIHEVWVWTFPYGGMWESHMMGKNAFWINSEPNSNPSCTELLSIMGLSYERDLACALESYEHRFESTMMQVYGWWDYDNKSTKDELTMWERFTGYVKNYEKFDPGKSNIGNIHFPPNGEFDYNWKNTTKVWTYADEWFNYPNVQEKKARLIDCSEWNCEHIGYMKWWFSHIPHYAGVNPKDGKLNNWWHYVVNYNEAVKLEKTLRLNKK